MPETQSQVFRRPAEAEWHPYIALITRKLVDGKLAKGRLMRRWTGAGWVYRAPSPSEGAEGSMQPG